MSKDIRIIILAARGVKELPGISTKKHETSLEWLLHSYHECGITDITVIGGKDIAIMKNKYKGIHLIFDPEWETSGMMHSLFLAKDRMDRDCIISYADVVYRSSLIQELIEGQHEDITLVADTSWKSRYPNRNEEMMLKKAEKIWLDESRVTKICKTSSDIQDVQSASGEFAGLCYFTKDSLDKMYSLYNKLSPTKNLYLTDLLQELLTERHINSVTTKGRWAEMDEPQDFGKFIFGTKSQTLARLHPILKSGTILPQYTFTVSDWRKEKEIIIKKIQKAFNESLLIVRSSTSMEDSFEESCAGMFQSELGVDRKDNNKLETAISNVIKSFGEHTKDDDQILVQPHVQNVALGGVLLTCDLKTGAPYYVINYECSGSTDAITAGREVKHHLIHVYKKSLCNIPDKHISTLIACAKELEKLTGNETIDIEFAIDTNENLFIFQIRPITSSNALINFRKHDISVSLKNAKEIIQKKLAYKPHISGKIGILGDMPDWNPAELIGSHPKPLSRSIFEQLITHDAWREARHILEYFNPEQEELMVMLCGHPYIDVRNSLNSYVPKTIPNPLREKLVNEALQYLREHPDSHDKLEFEVATTCYTPFIDNREKRWQSYGLNTDEICELKDHLLIHTEKLIRGEFYSIQDLTDRVRKLDIERKRLIKNADDLSSKNTVRDLLDICKTSGTIPFSSLARMAFIGSTFLKSFVEAKAITEDAYHEFLNSISTVASEMGDNLEKVREGIITLETFLEEYGHLRPGTYEIALERYDENPNLYFSEIHNKSKSKKDNKENSEIYSFKESDKAAMQNLLKSIGMNLNIDEVLTFTKESIRSRELAKFLFSRSVSDVLSIICTWGEDRGISREDLSYIEIQTLLTSMDDNINLDSTIAKAKEEYEHNQQIIMPQIIFSPEDAEYVVAIGSRPNFITSKKVTGKTIYISGVDAKKIDIDNKIVLIESADPGYDWIFTHNISGLITKYGGAASHMAIRAAEFGLPAAIGAGTIFDGLIERSNISLDCANNSIL